MEMERCEYTVGEILDLFRNNMLMANSEYQRGIVWNISQKKKLIDSVMRGYPLPLIYLHHIKKSVAGMNREDLEIIDGQQRINSLYEFAEGGYRLFHPIDDDAQARFPVFLKSQPCPWGGKEFHALTEQLQNHFLDTKLAIARITSDDTNEVRDLFVRLQAGLPLNGQERRDAWPGHFTDFILKLGGKPELARYPGHLFFQRVMRMKPRSDRGKTRQLSAQITMLCLLRRANGPDNFTDINSGAIDDFYHAHIDFDQSSANAQRLVTILDKLESLLGTGKLPKLRAHDAIHLVLLVDSLWDDYTRSWEATLPSAVDQFSASLANATKTKDSPNPDQFWLRYGQWTRVNSDRGDRIRQRHAFYSERMLEYLGPLQAKDPQRTFGSLEREIIYFRDGKKCAVCKADVAWSEAEFHHVQEHARGGKTVPANGVLVHQHCHPKGPAAQNFADNYFKHPFAPDSESDSLEVENAEKPDDSRTSLGNKARIGGSRKFPPDGTMCRFFYKGSTFSGTIEGGRLLVEGIGSFPSFSRASGEVSNTSRNGWLDWEIKLSGSDQWHLSDTWRKGSQSLDT